ncbi:calponin homology domain-containing protein [Paraphysoderma sedebokerense]|nr:calponin homology domain-containing protein [Paraphysoderma sedebokerense]
MQQKIIIKGVNQNTTHTINEDEKEQFVEHINSTLKSDKQIGSRFPINVKTMQIFEECKDGLLLAKLINDAVPDTIDERVLNVGKKLNMFQMTENNNVVINSAKAIGCSVVNIGSQDLIDGREYLILGLIWQIIKIGLLSKIDIQFHPELYRLLEPGEALEAFVKLPADQILLRWVNYHLKNAGVSRRVENFSTDVKDSEVYTYLLNQLAPSSCSKAPLQEKDLTNRAELVLQNADKVGCRKYLTPKSICEGNPKLNLAFCANLFNTLPGLAPLTQSELAALDEALFNSEGDREARAFALWMNSLGVEPFVNNLFDDLRDGLILLQAIDKVQPGIVDWKKVNKAPVTSRFKKVENTNYVIVLGKSLKFTLVGIQGADLTDGSKILTLGLVWQLMREHIVQTLRSLAKDGKEVTDADMIAWANATVARGGKSSSINTMKDSSLRTGVFFLDLLNGIKKDLVNYDLVTDGATDDAAKLNAKYAISIARKLGATIFVLPEDILDVKPKMILTFIGSLMAIDRSMAH